MNTLAMIKAIFLLFPVCHILSLSGQTVAGNLSLETRHLQHFKANNDTTPPRAGSRTISVDTTRPLMPVNIIPQVSSLSALRVTAPSIADASIMRVVTNKDVYDFIKDVKDKVSVDDNYMTIVDNTGGRWKRKVDVYINLKFFDATGNIGDNITDTKPALLAAFEYAKKNNRSFTLYVPKGQYALYTEVFYNFGLGITVSMLGDVSGGARYTGSAFIWHGSSGKAMFRFQSMYNSQISNIEFNGRNFNSGQSAKYIFHFEWVSEGLTSLINFSKCTFAAVAGDSSAAVNFNATGGIQITSKQVDESAFDNCNFSGNPINSPDSLKSWYGVIIGGNNTKNFSFTHNYIINFYKAAIKCSPAGGAGQIFSIRNLIGTGGWVFDLNKNTTLNSVGDYSEHVGGILKTPFSYNGYGNYNITGYENFSGNIDGSRGSAYPIPYTYFIEGGGNLHLQNSVFNQHTQVPKINWTTNSSIEPTAIGSATIIGCHFSNIKPGVTPFYSAGFPFFTENRENDYGRLGNTHNQPRFYQYNNVGTDSSGIVNNIFPDGSTSPFLTGGFFKTFTLFEKPRAASRHANTIRYNAGDIIKRILVGDARPQIKEWIVTKAGMFKTVNFTGTVTTNSNIVTGVSSTRGLEIGDLLVIPSGAGWINSAVHPVTISQITNTTITLSQRYSESTNSVKFANALPVFTAQGGAFGTSAERAALDTQLTANDIGFTYDNTTTGVPERWNGNSWSSAIVRGSNMSSADFNRLFTRQATLLNPKGAIVLNISLGAQVTINFSSPGSRTLAFTNLRAGDIFKIKVNNTSGSVILLTVPQKSSLSGVGRVTTIKIPVGGSLLQLSDYDGAESVFTLGVI